MGVCNTLSSADCVDDITIAGRMKRIYSSVMGILSVISAKCRL